MRDYFSYRYNLLLTLKVNCLWIKIKAQKFCQSGVKQTHVQNLKKITGGILFPTCCLFVCFAFVGFLLLSFFFLLVLMDLTSCTERKCPILSLQNLVEPDRS